MDRRRDYRLPAMGEQVQNGASTDPKTSRLNRRGRLKEPRVTFSAALHNRRSASDGLDCLDYLPFVGIDIDRYSVSARCAHTNAEAGFRPPRPDVQLNVGWAPAAVPGPIVERTPFPFSKFTRDLRSRRNWQRRETVVDELANKIHVSTYIWGTRGVLAKKLQENGALLPSFAQPAEP